MTKVSTKEKTTEAATAPEARVTKVNCPVCQKTVIWGATSPYRPFCSERCKLIDFGDWATEAHSIPGEPAPLDQFEDGEG